MHSHKHEPYPNDSAYICIHINLRRSLLSLRKLQFNLLSRTASVCVRPSVGLSVFYYVSLSHSLSMGQSSVCHCLTHLTVCQSVSHCQSLTVSLTYFSLSHSLSVCLSYSVSVCPSHSLSVDLVCQSVCLTHFLMLSLTCSLSQSVYELPFFCQATTT